MAKPLREGLLGHLSYPPRSQGGPGARGSGPSLLLKKYPGIEGLPGSLKNYSASVNQDAPSGGSVTVNAAGWPSVPGEAAFSVPALRTPEPPYVSESVFRTSTHSP